MRSPVAIAAVLTTWALVGLVAAVAMRRRGHSLAPWAALGDESEDDTVSRTRALLESEAGRWPGGTAGTVLLAGNPAQALVDHARQDGYDVVVVGTRGRGRSKGVLGSVAATLAKGAPVPVLMAGEGAVDAGVSTHGGSARVPQAAT